MTKPEPVRPDNASRLRLRIAALSQFGTSALHETDLDALLHAACRMVEEEIDAGLVKVLEFSPGADEMLIRAGVNWRPGVVGVETFGAHAHSPSGYALQEDAPVISPDTGKEIRFEIPAILVEHGVRSMVNVVIGGDDRPWGVLEADSRHLRDFDEDDVDFLQASANFLAAAIERLRRDEVIRRGAARDRILFGELRHRVRNLIVNVDALAKRTLRSSPDPERFAADFSARLAALGRTQDLLTRGSEAVDLRETLLQELQAHGVDGDPRVRIAGPEVMLPPDAAQALGMAFHELATNASKYGALRCETAGLAVVWDLQAGEAGGRDLVIRWREAGVPIPEAPSRRGFGSDTIERHLPYMLAGASSLTFGEDGVECMLRFPLDPPLPGEAARDA